MAVNLSLTFDELEMLVDAAFCMKRNYEEKMYYRSTFTDQYVAWCDLASYLFGESICAADVEANRQDAVAAISKRTASDLDPREAEDEVFLDHPIHVEQREV